MPFFTGLAHGSKPCLAAKALLFGGFVKGSSIRGIPLGSFNLSLDRILDKASVLRVFKVWPMAIELITHPGPPSRAGIDGGVEMLC